MRGGRSGFAFTVLQASTDRVVRNSAIKNIADNVSFFGAIIKLYY